MKPKTFVATPKTVVRRWHLVDFDDQVLGRAATVIAGLLIGKHKPDYSPHLDCGDYAVVVNAAKVKLTGNKPDQKIYRWHTGYPGGFRERPFKKQLELHPDRIITAAVSRMLPKNKLRPLRLKRLKVFAGPTPPYEDKLKMKSEK
jgi:large subunit ribosomal protein L13